MKHLLRSRLESIKNSIKGSDKKKYFLFLILGIGILAALGFFFSRVFGYLYHQQEFPMAFKLFLSEKILMMVFLTMYSMLIMSALISTLNIFFLSRDLQLLLASPMKLGRVFTWKSLEVTLNSASMVIFFSMPALYAYHYYFAPHWTAILASTLVFLLYVATGVAIGIMLGVTIPTFFSARRLQPVLSLVSIALISFIVIFLRLLRPEQLINPDSIDNLFQYMGGMNFDYMAYFPFYWIARGLTHIAKGEIQQYWTVAGLFAITFIVLAGALAILQKKLYFTLLDKLGEGSRGGFRSKWKSKPVPSAYRAMWQKEIKTFSRSPSQWSQLLIIGAMVVVFILNLKSIPLPHPSIKTFIAFLNLGMAAFIVVGLGSRFVFTAIPMEGPGISHLMASPYDKRKFFRFKLMFYLVPQYIIGFILFFTGDIALQLDPFMRVTGILFLLPTVLFLTVFALYFGLSIKESVPLSPQHLLVTKQGISYMLWSFAYIIGSMFYFVRPLFIFYYSTFRHRDVPFVEIGLWFAGFFLLNIIAIVFYYRRGRKLWLEREFL